MAKKISKKNSFIGENIRRIRQAKSLSQSEFSSLLGLTRGALAAYEEGRSEPKIESIIHIANYLSISIDALLTKQLSVSEIYSMDRVNKKLDQVHGGKILEKSSSEVSLVRADQFLDYVIRHTDAEFIKSLSQISSPISLNGARAFEMKGNDMENDGHGLNPSDLLFCTKVEKSKWENLRDTVAVVVTEDEVVCKRVKELKNSQLLLSSDANGVSDLVKDISTISEVWTVKGHYSERIEPPSQMENRMSQLEEMVRKLVK